MKKQKLCKVALGIVTAIILAFTTLIATGCGKVTVDDKLALSMLERAKPGDFILAKDGTLFAVIQNYKQDENVLVRTPNGEQYLRHWDWLAKETQNVIPCCSATHSIAAQHFLLTKKMTIAQ